MNKKSAVSMAVCTVLALTAVGISAAPANAATVTTNSYKNGSDSQTGAILHDANASHVNLSSSITVQPGSTKSFLHHYGSAGGVNVWLPKQCTLLVTEMIAGVPAGSTRKFINSSTTGHEQWIGSLDADYFFSFSGTNRCQG